MSASAEELVLIERAKKGDLDAFEALYEMHKMPIYRTALVITGERMAAEEILQETFLKAFKHIQKFHKDTSLSPWLYRVAVNMAYDVTARNKRGLRILGGLVDWLTAPPESSPERNIETQELQDVIYEAIGRLEFKQRATLALFYLQDFSLQEISDIMDVPVGTVKSRLHYARLNLRRELLADKRLSQGMGYEFA